MAQATAIRLTGDDLRLADVWTVAVDGARAELSDESRSRMAAARELVERSAHGSREHTYGLNTGFGRFASRSIPDELTAELQLRLLRSHACGVGDPYPREIVRAAMVLRANALAKGNSGLGSRPWSCSSRSSTEAFCLSFRAVARSAPRGTSRRWRISRC